MGAGMGDMQMGIITFTFVTNWPTWGWPNSLEMSLNAWGKEDHSVGRTWSGWLHWSARMFFPRIYLATMVTTCRSDQGMIPWAGLQMSRDTVPPCFLRYIITLALSFTSAKASPMFLCKKAFKVNWIAFISKILIWSSLSCDIHVSPVVKSYRCAPHLVWDASVYRRRDGRGTSRGAWSSTFFAVTIWCIAGILPKNGLALLGHLLRLPNENSAATEVMHHGFVSGNKPFQRSHAAENLLPHLCLWKW